MGGGSSYVGSTTSDSISQAGDVFDSATKDIEKKVGREREHRVRNVFISFHNEDERKVDLLRSQARREEYGIDFRDHSVKAKIDAKWKKEVDKKIDSTSATIVMIGEHTAERTNVAYEVERSYAKDKKVIGVMIRSDRNYKVPKQMKENNAHIVPWKLDAIQSELDKS